MRSEFLPFAAPSIGPEEISEVVDALGRDWLTTGPKVHEFEERFSAAVGAEAALAVNSCTAALHVALKAAGVGPGDRVISTPMTFCSSIHVIEHVGAVPVLVDVEPDTLNIDPRLVAEAVAQADGSVKALLPVHVYGHPADMEALDAVAAAKGLVVVEDAAHALPATIAGRRIGQADRPGGPPHLVAFSFYATKNLTTGEGGMLTGPRDLIDEARVWALHGLSRDAYKRYEASGSWYYEVTRPGFKYNMGELQGALGLAQLRRLPEMQARRDVIAAMYSSELGDLPEIQLPTVRPNVEAAWHIYPIRLRLEALDIDRADFIGELTQANIGTSVHFIPVHVHPYFRDHHGYRPEDFPVAYGNYLRLVSLPIYPRMTDADVADVVAAVRDTVTRHRR